MRAFRRQEEELSESSFSWRESWGWMAEALSSSFGENQMLLLGGSSWRWDCQSSHGFSWKRFGACCGAGWGPPYGTWVGDHPGLSFFPFNSMCPYILNIKSVRMSMPSREGLWGWPLLDKERREVCRRLQASPQGWWGSWLLHLEDLPEVEMHTQPVHLFIPVSDVSGGKTFPTGNKHALSCYTHRWSQWLAFSKRKLVKLSCYACGFRGWQW